MNYVYSVIISFVIEVTEEDGGKLEAIISKEAANLHQKLPTCSKLDRKLRGLLVGQITFEQVKSRRKPGEDLKKEIHFLCSLCS